MALYVYVRRPLQTERAREAWTTRDNIIAIHLPCSVEVS